jgi:hypothetical protein
MSTFGDPVFRRCKRIWVDGELMGVAFDRDPIGAKPLMALRHDAELI